MWRWCTSCSREGEARRRAAPSGKMGSSCSPSGTGSGVARHRPSSRPPALWCVTPVRRTVAGCGLRSGLGDGCPQTPRRRGAHESRVCPDVHPRVCPRMRSTWLLQGGATMPTKAHATARASLLPLATRTAVPVLAACSQRVVTERQPHSSDAWAVLGCGGQSASACASDLANGPTPRGPRASPPSILEPGRHPATDAQQGSCPTLGSMLNR